MSAIGVHRHMPDSRPRLLPIRESVHKVDAWHAGMSAYNYMYMYRTMQQLQTYIHGACRSAPTTCRSDRRQQLRHCTRRRTAPAAAAAGTRGSARQIRRHRVLLGVLIGCDGMHAYMHL